MEATREAGDWFQATQDPFGYQQFPLARCQFETKENSKKEIWLDNH